LTRVLFDPTRRDFFWPNGKKLKNFTNPNPNHKWLIWPGQKKLTWTHHKYIQLIFTLNIAVYKLWLDCFFIFLSLGQKGFPLIFSLKVSEISFFPLKTCQKLFLRSLEILFIGQTFSFVLIWFLVFKNFWACVCKCWNLFAKNLKMKTFLQNLMSKIKKVCKFFYCYIFQTLAVWC